MLPEMVDQPRTPQVAGQVFDYDRARDRGSDAPKPVLNPESERVKTHTREASQDINPAPSKRAREDTENASPTVPAVQATSSATGQEAPKRRRGRPRKEKAEPDAHGGASQEVAKSAGTDWADPEVMKLLEGLFGGNAITEFSKFEKDPGRYCKKVRT